MTILVSFSNPKRHHAGAAAGVRCSPGPYSVVFRPSTRDSDDADATLAEGMLGQPQPAEPAA
ncbi:MAG: hypothetical protein ACYCSX_14825 [Acidimicrobiales bacterium]